MSLSQLQQALVPKLVLAIPALEKSSHFSFERTRAKSPTEPKWRVSFFFPKRKTPVVVESMTAARELTPASVRVRMLSKKGDSYLVGAISPAEYLKAQCSALNMLTPQVAAALEAAAKGETHDPADE